jgi:hypothetical protein
MHPLSSGAYQASMGYPGMDAGGQQQSPPEAESPNSHHDPINGAGDQNGPSSNYTDINQILDQILNITDQSLDEAQVNFMLCFKVVFCSYLYQFLEVFVTISFSPEYELDT